MRKCCILNACEYFLLNSLASMVILSLGLNRQLQRCTILGLKGIQKKHTTHGDRMGRSFF